MRKGQRTSRVTATEGEAISRSDVEAVGQRREEVSWTPVSSRSGTCPCRIADLQAALFRMKQQYETAQKRIREESELKNKFEQDLIREQQRIQELTVQNEQQQKILKLKTEGLVAAQRKLRGAPTTDFEGDMEKLVAERKELEILRDDVQKREELIQKRELLLNERTELETKKLRTSQALNKVRSDIILLVCHRCLRFRVWNRWMKSWRVSTNNNPTIRRSANNSWNNVDCLPNVSNSKTVSWHRRKRDGWSRSMKQSKRSIWRLTIRTTSFINESVMFNNPFEPVR